MLSPPALLGQLRRRLFWRPPVEPVEHIDGSRFLAKAACDHWDYAIGLRSGLIVHCREVKHRGDWLKLVDVEHVCLSNGRELLAGSFAWGRGIECRVADVSWIADCDS